MQQELKLLGNQLSGVTAGAGLARKDIAQRHRFHSISSLTTTKDHAGSELVHLYPTSFLLMSFLWVAGCKVSRCVCDPQPCCFVPIHQPFLPACIPLQVTQVALGRQLFCCCVGRHQGKTQPVPQEMFPSRGHKNILCQRPYSWCKVVNMIHTTKGLKC